MLDFLPPCLLILAISFLCTAGAEAVSWVLIYRKESYKVLKKSIEQLTKRLDKKKESLPSLAKQKQKDKRVNIIDQQLKAKQQALTVAKFKSTMLVGAIMLGVFAFLNSTFDGMVVAKLPFVPIPLLQGLTHRNLAGTDFTDCSMMFLYALCSYPMRSNIQKYFGFAPPPSATPNFLAEPS